jgi:alpha-glucosidase (family GH31 glycosyl hydrolase)
MLHTFAALTGRPTMPPAWAFGPWMSSNEWNTQARVLREVQATKHHTIPATVLVIEAWSDETTFYVWNGAHYTPSDGAAALRVEDFQFPAEGPWPDPKAMIDALHDAGIRVVLWQIPALKQAEAPHAQHDADVAHAIEQGYVIRDAAAQPYRNPAFWFNGAFIPDFTNDAATTWWLNKRAYLLDQLGIDGFKTDGGEHLQGRGLQAHDGRRGDELVNAFPNLYVAAYHRFVQDHRHGDALTFSRAGHTGAGAFPAHWAGDENSTWEAYRRSIVAGLTAGISGIPFWGWDIAGFSEALPTAELYVRATAMAAFCPIMQYHSEYNPHGPSRDRTPWNIQRHTGDSRVIPLARFFAQLRMNLLPYIVSEAAHCVASGEPLMRPLLLDDPHDPHAWRVQDQYRFGRHLLVAPVVAEGTLERHLYLPPGTWYDLWDGITLEGGQWIDVAVPWDRIPVYVRAGTILPLNLGRRGALGDDVGNSVDQYDALTFWLYPTDHTEYVWTDTHGEQRRIVAEQAVDGRVQVTLPALPVECTLVLPHGAVQHVTALDHTQTITLRKNV